MQSSSKQHQEDTFLNESWNRGKNKDNWGNDSAFHSNNHSSRSQQQQPDWSHPPPPAPETDAWNSVPPEDDGKDEDNDLPFGMHHFSTGVKSRRSESIHRNSNCSNTTNQTSSNDQKPPSTIPAPPIVREMDPKENGPQNVMGVDQARNDISGPNGADVGNNDGGFSGNNESGPNLSHGGVVGQTNMFNDSHSGSGINYGNMPAFRSSGQRDIGTAPSHESSNNFGRDSDRVGTNFMHYNDQGNFVMAPDFQGNDNMRNHNMVNNQMAQNCHGDNIMRNSSMDNNHMVNNFQGNNFTQNSNMNNNQNGQNVQAINFERNRNNDNNQMSQNFQGNNFERNRNMDNNQIAKNENAKNINMDNTRVDHNSQGNNFPRNNMDNNQMVQNFHGNNQDRNGVIDNNQMAPNLHGQNENIMNSEGSGNERSGFADNNESFLNSQMSNESSNCDARNNRFNNDQQCKEWDKQDVRNDGYGDNDLSKNRTNDSGLDSFNDGNITDFGDGQGTNSVSNDLTDIRRTTSSSNLSDFSDGRRRTVSGSSDFSPLKPSYKNSALPIGALLPPLKSNPFDVLFEKPYKPLSNLAALTTKGLDDSRGSSAPQRAKSFTSTSTPTREFKVDVQTSADKAPGIQSEECSNDTRDDMIRSDSNYLSVRQAGNVGVRSGNDQTGIVPTGNCPGQQYFVALVNMDWNINFQGVTEFMKPAREGSRGTYPCYGVRGKYNGNFAIQLDSEEDLITVLSKDGSFWSYRKVITYRILEKQFVELEMAFKNQVPYIIERPPANAFDVPFASSGQRSQTLTSRENVRGSIIDASRGGGNSDALVSSCHGDSTSGDEQDLSQPNPLSINIPQDKDLRVMTESIPSTPSPSKLIYEHRKRELGSSGKTVFEYNNGESAISPVISKPSSADDGSRRKQNSGGSESSMKLFESRSDVEKRSSSSFNLLCDNAPDDRFRCHNDFEEKSRKIIGDYPITRPLMELSTSSSKDVDQRKPRPLLQNIRSQLNDPPAFSSKPGILGSPPVHRSSPITGIRWIGVVKNPASDVSRKEVRQILGNVRTIDEGVHVLHPRKMFPDELIFLEFDNQEALYEGLEQLRNVQRVVGRETRVFRVTQQQYLDCTAAYERGSRFMVEPPSVPALQHFFVQVRHAPSSANASDLADMLLPIETFDIHQMAMSPASPVSSFVAEVIGRSDLAAVLSLDKQQVDLRHQLNIFRIVRFQYEDAVASSRKRIFMTIKEPLSCELEADDRWYAEYIERYDREMRTFAFDFKPKSSGDFVNKSNSGGKGKSSSPGSGGRRDSPRRGKAPTSSSKEDRSENRDRSSSKGKDAYQPRSRSPSRSRDNEGKHDRDGKRDSDMRRGRGGRGVDRFGRNRDNSRDRDRKTDDDKFAERKKGGKNDSSEVVVIDDDDGDSPTKPVKANSSGKYGLQITGLDSRVPQSRINAFFSKMGVKLSNLRIVVRPGAPMAVAFVETTDYAVYKKAFEYEGHLLDGKFPIHMENVAVSSISKRFVDIRKGLWFPKPAPATGSGSASTSTAYSTAPCKQVSVPGVVRPLMGNMKEAPATEVKKPVAVVTPGNRIVTTPSAVTTFSVVAPSSTGALSVQVPASVTSSATTLALTTPAQTTSASSSSKQFDAMSFIERNLASRPAGPDAVPSTFYTQLAAGWFKCLNAKLVLLDLEQRGKRKTVLRPTTLFFFAS